MVDGFWFLILTISTADACLVLDFFFNKSKFDTLNFQLSCDIERLELVCLDV